MESKPLITVYLPSYRLISPQKYFHSPVLDMHSLSTTPGLILKGSETLSGEHSVLSNEGQDPLFLHRLGEQADRIIYFAAEASPEGGLVFLEEFFQNIKRLENLKKLYGTKIILALAGDSNSFVPALQSKLKQENLADDLLMIIQKYNLDGLNIDWEFPEKKQLKPYENFLRILRNKMESFQNLSLEITTHYNRPLSKKIYRLANFVHIMAGNLFPAEQESFQALKISLEFFRTIYKIPSKKISIFIPLYTKEQDWRKALSYKSIFNRHEMQNSNKYDRPDKKSQKNPHQQKTRALLMRKLEWLKKQGVGSISIWEAGQDSPQNSLIRQIKDFFYPK